MWCYVTTECLGWRSMGLRLGVKCFCPFVRVLRQQKLEKRGHESVRTGGQTGEDGRSKLGLPPTEPYGPVTGTSMWFFCLNTTDGRKLPQILSWHDCHLLNFYLCSVCCLAGAEQEGSSCRLEISYHETLANWKELRGLVVPRRKEDFTRLMQILR